MNEIQGIALIIAALAVVITVVSIVRNIQAIFRERPRKCVWFPGERCTDKCDHDLNGCDRLEPPAEFWERKMEDALPDDLSPPKTRPICYWMKAKHEQEVPCPPECRNHGDRIKTPLDCLRKELFYTAQRGRLD